MNTVFKPVGWKVQGLVDSVESGVVQLPDLQRPFVWPKSKIRDLLDSMYRGYPVGELMFWNVSQEDSSRTISGATGRTGSHQIIDGQQRLTSLYAVFKGAAVRDADYNSKRMSIAFNPLTEKFEVTNTAIEKSVDWISNVSDFFGNTFKIRRSFKKRYEEARGELSEDMEELIEERLGRLDSLRNYEFTVVEIQPDANKIVVADIFVRINSEGVSLKASDFILTWLSVFWPEGRELLEGFARDSRLTPQRASEIAERPVSWTPINNYLAVDAGQLVRVLVAVGQNRAKLGDAYNALQAKDRSTGFVVPDRQEAELAKLKAALPLVLKELHWTEFIRCLAVAGFKSRKMVTSDMNILSSYALWIMGRTRFGVDITILRNLMARWLFMSQLSGRYTGSAETQLQKDLDRLTAISGNEASSFVSTLESVIAAELSEDFWTLRMPDSLISSSSALSPSYQAYLAALNILDADMFMLNNKVQQWMDPSLPATKGTEGHHLNPRKYLENVVGIRDLKKINQVANFAPTDWSTNNLISDRAPADYWPALVRERGFDDESLRQQMFWHALPDGWESMDYEEFLYERRVLLAQVTRAGYERLKWGQSEAPAVTPLTAKPSEANVQRDIADLMEAGVLSSGDLLSPVDDSIRMRAEVTDDGVVVIDGHEFGTLNAAAHHAGADNVPGVEFWQVENPEGEQVSIQSLMAEAR
ncbi:GmrSD restriction endonuclease domain-containing protein [Arthrobacter koreensis]|uniref:GmrSD restriction endonuclease domain-containing protein n=1 Tax=Arthrobacter koreensis TaxID=199136 RepID=UPI003D8D7D8C